jgi:hypothetical protein
MAEFGALNWSILLVYIAVNLYIVSPGRRSGYLTRRLALSSCVHCVAAIKGCQYTRREGVGLSKS